MNSGAFGRQTKKEGFWNFSIERFKGLVVGFNYATR
jgi:hypothetical protein